MGVGKMWGRGKWWGKGIGVMACLSHSIHNLAGGMLCVAFFVMDAKL